MGRRSALLNIYLPNLNDLEFFLSKNVVDEKISFLSLIFSSAFSGFGNQLNKNKETFEKFSFLIKASENLETGNLKNFLYKNLISK